MAYKTSLLPTSRSGKPPCPELWPQFLYPLLSLQLIARHQHGLVSSHGSCPDMKIVIQFTQHLRQLHLLSFSLRRCPSSLHYSPAKRPLKVRQYHPIRFLWSYFFYLLGKFLPPHSGFKTANREVPPIPPPGIGPNVGIIAPEAAAI